MKLVVRNIFTQALKISKEEERILSNAMSFYVPNYRFMPAYKLGTWDGKKRFYDKRSKTFLTGLLPFVVKLSKKEKFKIKIKDTRILPIDEHRIEKGLVLLRPYQQKELRKVFYNTLKIRKKVIPWVRGVVKQPTGSGKSFFAAAIIKVLNKRTLFVVGRLDLLYQTKAVFEKTLKKDIGLIGNSEVDLKKVTVATVQTLVSRQGKELGEYLDSVDVLMFDECHHVSAGSSGKGQYHKIATSCPAQFRFGFSASPLSRGDLGDVMLIADTGEIISDVKRKKLEQEGYLAKVNVYLHEIAEPRVKGEPSFVYKKSIVENEERNQIILEEAEKAWKRKEHVLILVRYLSHGNELLYRCLSRKLPAVFLKGSTNVKNRRKAIKKVANAKRPMVIIASTIFDEGVDAPDIKTLILAGAGASRIKSIQRVGRGTRPKSSGENSLTVIDFVDRMADNLESHSLERIAAYEQEGFSIVKL